MFKSRGSKPEWRIVYDELLAEADYGDVITYQQVAGALGCDPEYRARLRGPIVRARQQLGALRTMWLVAVPNVGYRVIQANEHVLVASDHQHRARRQLQRVQDVDRATNLSKLTREELSMWDSQTRTNALHMAVLVSHESRIRRLEEVFASFGGGIPS